MILFYTEKITPRIEYITHFIFNQILQVSSRITDKKDDFMVSELPKINYSETRFSDEIHIKPHSLLFENKICSQNLHPIFFNNRNAFFETSGDSFLPFDLFAASFYLVSRYEEYLVTECDQFGRFQAENSILFQLNLLKTPVINKWAQLLATEISKKYPGVKFSDPKFRFLSTIDIDNAWAYKNKGVTRVAGAFLKSVLKGNFSEITERFLVLSGSKNDPFDTFEYIDSIFKDNEEKVRFFFLLGNYGKYDKNISPSNHQFQQLINQTAEKYETGIHPSYAAGSNKTGTLVLKEKLRLDKITGLKTKISRQHYLKLEMPATYQKFIKAGIEQDFTMGYASHTGFRAGTCTPFYFYEFEKEQATNLLVTPFQVMDRTLLNYLRLSPEKAIEETMNLMNEVKNAGGTFVTLWHNDSVSDCGEWKGFRNVFEEIHKTGFRLANE